MRIVGGALGGRTLRAPRGLATRPTSDRVREALFSILGPLHELSVLDLFAGSGALGLEALSRGAAGATFVDRAGASIEAIRRNLAELDLEGDVHRMEALSFLERTRAAGRQYDLVFVDPPYRRAEALASRLAATLPGVLRPGARVVAESETRAPLELEPELRLRDQRRYGQTLIRFYGPP